MPPDGTAIALRDQVLRVVRDEHGGVIDGEHVVTLKSPAFPGSSRELKGPQGELKGAAQRFSHADRGVAGEPGAVA
jgi:hypothetical protein